MELNKCRKCNEPKTLDQFPVSKKTGKHSPWCKACHYKAHQTWKQQNYAKYLDYQKQWRLSHLSEMADYYNMYNADPDNAAKQAARTAVHKAVNNKQLIKPLNCSICGGEAHGRDMHAHHANYNDPLNVIWVCKSCHSMIHTKTVLHSTLIQQINGILGCEVAN